jgi:hypothetical protein
MHCERYPGIWGGADDEDGLEAGDQTRFGEKFNITLIP